MEYGRNTVGECDLLPPDQFKKCVRGVLARINLLHPQHGGHKRHAPGMNMEHGGYGHVNILPVETAMPHCRPQHPQHPQSMQHKLAVAEVNPLGHAGGAGGVEGGGAGVLVEVREIKLRGCCLKQRLVFACKGDGGGWHRRLVI